VPEGISAVVHAPLAACVDADVEAGGAAVEALDVVPPPAEVDVEAEAAPGFATDPDEDVLATDDGLPDVDAPPPALFEVLLEQPAVRATVPSAPTANKTEIRFMEPNLPG
jgi:hypothetical protein